MVTFQKKQFSKPIEANEVPKQKLLELILAMAFSIVLLDSLITYFSRTTIGIYLPVSLVLPFILAFILFKWGRKLFDIPNSYVLALVLGELSIFVGFVINGGLSVTRVGAPILAVCAFLIGYLTFRWVKDERYIVNALTVVGVAYVVTCIIALMGLYPALFPVINAEWSNKGVIELRPEVTTDQNFQIFYLMPLVTLLAVRLKLWHFTLVLLTVLLGIVVLIKLQTRSGVLVYTALLGIVWLAPFWSKSLNKSKLLLLPVIIIGLLVVYMDALINIASLLLARFGESGAVGAAQGRLESITYFFEKIWNPLWWLPQGYAEYKMNHFGDIPHSNITALFLEGGIFAFYMWVVIFLAPMVSLSICFIKKKLSGIEVAVFYTGLAMLIIQLTLNVPFFKQPWIWAGAILGALMRFKSVSITTKDKNQKEETDKRQELAVSESSSVTLK